MFEQLENRRLLAGIGGGAAYDPYEFGPAEATLENGVLTINNAHSVQINDFDTNNPTYYPPTGTVYLIDKGVPGNTTSIFSGVTLVIVNGTKETDNISVSINDAHNTFDGVFNGGSGSDSITVGNNSGGDMIVHGGRGNDSIWADDTGSGTTTVYGEGGRDTFDWIRGGAVFYQ